MPLLDSFRRAFSSRDDAAGVDPHSWHLPSSYSAPKRGATETVIPNPRVFAGALIPRQPQTASFEVALAYPETGHAAVHLALLECFWNLRLSASALDVQASAPPAYEEKPSSADAAASAKPSEPQRWHLLVDLAVARFAAWWTNIDDVLRHATAYAHHGSGDVAVQLSKNHLPPLDVLLVWYAFMLNTDAYYQSTSHKPHVQKLCFPWPAIREAIDMEKMQFSLPRSAQTLFSTMSTQSADILTYLEKPPAYTDPNNLPFGLNLAAEVKKLDDFVDKAHKLLWIRAPSLSGSLSRASQEYLSFQLSRGVAEPTTQDAPFGIELLWKTHRLFPSQYQIFLSHFGLDGESTTQTRILTSDPTESNDVYTHINPGQCYCWTCERIRDDLPNFIHSSALEISATPLPAASSATMQGQLSSLPTEKMRQIQDDLGFYHAVEDARRRCKPLPTRPPTAAEKEAERFSAQRQREAGYLPGLNEYIQVLPDGTRKIRRQKYVTAFGNLAAV